MINERKSSVRERLIGKSLIGFDTREPRLPLAMVGSPTVEVISRVSGNPTMAAESSSQ